MKITKEQYYKAKGMLVLAKEYDKRIQDLEMALGVMLGEQGDGGYYGFVSDAIFNDVSLDRLLEQLEVEVE